MWYSRIECIYIGSWYILLCTHSAVKSYRLRSIYVWILQAPIIGHFSIFTSKYRSLHINDQFVNVNQSTINRLGSNRQDKNYTPLYIYPPLSKGNGQTQYNIAPPLPTYRTLRINSIIEGRSPLVHGRCCTHGEVVPYRTHVFSLNWTGHVRWLINQSLQKKTLLC